MPQQSNKEIKFSFSIDQHSVSQVKTAFREILGEAQRIGAGAMPGMGPILGAGGAFSPGGRLTPITPLAPIQGMMGGTNTQDLLQSFNRFKDAFKDVANSVRDSSGSMAAAMRVSSEAQKRYIEELTQEVRAADQAFKDLEKTQKNMPEYSRDILGRRDREAAAKRVFDANTALRQAEDQMRAGTPGAPGAPGGFGALMGGVSSALMVAGGGISMTSNFIQRDKTEALRNAATQQNLQRAMLHRMMSGDTTDIFLLSQTQNMNALVNAGGTGALYGGLFGQGLKTMGIIGGATAAGAMVGPWGAAAAGGLALMQQGGSIVDMLLQATRGGPEAQAIQTQLAAVEAIRGQNPIYEAMFGQVQAQAHLRRDASRTLLGQHMRYGYSDPRYTYAENLALATTAGRRFGLNQIGDTRIFTGQWTPDRIVEVARAQNQSRMGDLAVTGDPYYSVGSRGTLDRAERDRLIRTQPSAPTVYDLDYQPGQKIYRTIPGLMRSIRQAQDRGISQDAALDILGNLQMAGGGGARGMESARRDFFSMMAEAVKQGTSAGLGPAAAEAIGKAMAEAAFTGGGLTGTGNYGRLLARSGYEGNTMYDVQNRTRGLQAVQDLSQNNLLFANLATARAAALMPGASGYQIEALKMATPAELLNPLDPKNTRNRLDVYGISTATRQAFLREKLLQPFMMSLPARGTDTDMDAVYSVMDKEGIRDPFKAMARSGLSAEAQRHLSAVIRANASVTFPKSLGYGVATGARQVGEQVEKIYNEINAAQGVDQLSPKQIEALMRQLPRGGDAMAESSIATQQRTLSDLMAQESAIRAQYIIALRAYTEAEKELRGKSAVGSKEFQDLLEAKIRTYTKEAEDRGLLPKAPVKRNRAGQ